MGLNDLIKLEYQIQEFDDKITRGELKFTSRGIYTQFGMPSPHYTLLVEEYIRAAEESPLKHEAVKIAFGTLEWLIDPTKAYDKVKFYQRIKAEFEEA